MYGKQQLILAKIRWQRKSNGKLDGKKKSPPMQNACEMNDATTFPVTMLLRKTSGRMCSKASKEQNGTIWMIMDKNKNVVKEEEGILLDPCGPMHRKKRKTRDHEWSVKE